MYVLKSISFTLKLRLVSDTIWVLSIIFFCMPFCKVCINYDILHNIPTLGGVPCGAFYTTQIWVYEIQECLFLYSVYWFMAFTIKMPLSVNICLCFYLTLMSSTLVMVHPSHCFGGLARPLRCWARPLIYHKQGINIYIYLWQY